MAFLPTGGLYVTGGLISNNIDRIMLSSSTNIISINTTTTTTCTKDDDDEESLFMKAYRSKGRASFLLDDIPLYAVVAKDTGLRGAAVRANMVRIYCTVLCFVLLCLCALSYVYYSTPHFLDNSLYRYSIATM